MAYDLEEQEQLDQIKAFWSKWGNLLTWAAIAVAIAFTAYFGYKYYVRSQALEAAPVFEQLEKAAGNLAADTKNPQLVNDLTTTLTTKYASTPYAAMGALIAAKVSLEQKQTDGAIKQLLWVVEHAKDLAYSQLARVRLAQVYIDNKQADKALELVSVKPEEGFESLFADRKGDAFNALGKKAEAIAAYQQAWSSAKADSAIKDVIEQKLTLLGSEPLKSSESIKK